jgi:hypothetical protein
MTSMNNLESAGRDLNPKPPIRVYEEEFLITYTGVSVTSCDIAVI